MTLNRTQSAVSMQIKRLEEQLQAELFHRTKANVDLSAAGEQLLGYARRILSLNEEAVGRVRAHRVEGRVRLGVMDDYGTLLVPPLLASFIANYPLIDVEMETGLTSTMTDRLGKTYNIVIAMHPEGHSEGELLRREQAVWAASAERRVEVQALCDPSVRQRIEQRRIRLVNFAHPAISAGSHPTGFSPTQSSVTPQQIESALKLSTP